MRITVAFTAIALIAAPASANATSPQAAAPSVTIDASDLDLSTTQGVSRLDDRLQIQIQRMCNSGSRDSAARKMERACEAAAHADAQPKVRFAIAQANSEKVRLASATLVAPEA